MNAILFEMFGRGFDVIMGPHDPGLDGFFALFFSVEDGCDTLCLGWDDVGHGESLLEAIQMARSLALGESVEVPAPEMFL